MTAFEIRHPNGRRAEDVLLESDPLGIRFVDGWAVFYDETGPCYAVPATSGAHIVRLDPADPPAPPDQEPEKE